MNEEKETEIISVEEEEGENEDNGERAIIEEMGRVVVSPIVVTEDLPPPIV